MVLLALAAAVYSRQGPQPFFTALSPVHGPDDAPHEVAFTKVVSHADSGLSLNLRVVPAWIGPSGSVTWFVLGVGLGVALLARRAEPTPRRLVEAAPVEPPRSRTRPFVAALVRAETVLVPRWVHRLVLVAGSVVLGLFSLVGLVVLLALWSSDPDVSIVLDDEVVPPGTRPPMLVVASAGEAVVGVLLLVAAVALVVGRDRVGIRLCRAGLSPSREGAG